MARSVADVETLAPSWRLSLEAENKFPAPITSYTYATTRLVAFLRDKGMSNDVNAIAREHIEAFLVDVLERRSPATAQARYRAFRQFFAWCEAEGEITVTPMARMKPPRVPEQPVDVPTVEDLQKLLAACEGNDLEARRDTAIVRLFADSGLRLAELTGLRLTDVDLSAGMVGVTGKGDLFRTASFGRKTAKAIDRYLRPRRAHADAESEATWLGLKGPLTEAASVRCSGGVPKRLASRGCIRTSSALLRALMARRRWAAVRSDGAHRVAYEDDGHEVRGLDAGRACPRCSQSASVPVTGCHRATAASNGRSIGIIVRRQAGGSRRSRLGIPVGVITSTRTKTTGLSGEPRSERPSRADEHIEAPGPLPRSRVRSAR